MDGVDELIKTLDTLSSRENAAPAEVFKGFNEFNGKNRQQIAKNISSILENFQPQTRIGRILKIRLIDRYGVHSEVVKLLQSTDSLDTNLALKCRWFFADLNGHDNVTNADILNQMLPNLSQSVRLKVVNKYAANMNNAAVGEAMYNRLKSLYGAREAVLLLPACSESFIRDELANLSGFLLRPNLVEALQKKYPALATEYLTYLVDKESPHNLNSHRHSFYDYNYLFRNMSQTDLQTFLNVHEKHHENMMCFYLGRRVLKTLIRVHFNYILSKYEICKYYLRDRYFCWLSRAQLQELYTSKILPPTLTEFFELSHWESAWTVLKDHFKPEARSSTLRQALQTKYGKDLFSEDYLTKFSDFWMNCMPVDCRVLKVEKKLTTRDNPREQAELLAYLPLDQSLPRLKKLIESQSDADVRSSIAPQMIRTLKHNQHPSGLKDLFTYFNKRFRNEAKPFRERLLSELHDSKDSKKFLLQLNKNDWSSLDEFIDIIRLNREVPDVMWQLTDLMKIQIHCYFLRNIDIEPHLQRYYDILAPNKDFTYSDWLVICRNTPYQRVCVEWFLGKIPSIEWKNNSSKLSSIEQILRVVVEVNKKRVNTLNPIVIPEEVIVEMESLMKESSLLNDWEFKNMLGHARHFPYIKDRLLKFEFPSYVKEDILSRFLKRDPLLVHDKLEQLLAITFDSNFKHYQLFYAKCRLYESYGIPQKIAKICLRSLKLEEDGSLDPKLLETSVQPHAVRVLSLLLQPAEYTEVISKYTPTQGTIEDYSPEAIEMFALQKAVCQSFVTISNPSVVLPQLRKFAVGDYLKIAVGSLNSVCSRVPEKEVLPILKAWNDCPISLRKHILRLTYRLAPTDQRRTFVELFQKEKNSSIRQVIFLEIRRTFIAEPSDETYNMMSSVVYQLTPEDEILKDITNVDGMDKAYVSRYLEMIWNKIDDWKSTIPNGKAKLIERIDKCIAKHLDSTFCTELLIHDLNVLPKPLSKFVYSCLLHAPSWGVHLARLGQVVSALTRTVEKEWNERQTEPGHVFQVRRTVFEFVKELCEESRNCEDTQTTAKILTETKAALAGMKVDSLKLSYWLDAHVVFLQNKDNFEPALARMYSTYVHQYHNLAPHSVVETLSNVVPMVSSNKFAYELVKTELPICQILATKIADKQISKDEDLNLVNQMIDILISSEHTEVQSAAAAYFEVLESSVII